MVKLPFMLRHAFAQKDKIKYIDTNVVGRWSVRDKDWLIDLTTKEKNYDLFQGIMQDYLRGKNSYRRKDLLRQAPLQLARKVDLVTNNGMNQLAKLATNKSSLGFRYMNAGSGTTAEGLGNSALTTELVRIDLDAIGTRFDLGTQMKFSGFFNESSPSATYAEFGLNTASSAGVQCVRTLIDVGDRIVFTTGDDVMTLTTIISQTST